MKSLVAAILCLSLLVLPLPALAADQVDDGAVVGDVLFARPLGVASVILGSALFVLALPFSIPSGSVRKAGWTLVVNPSLYTFRRPLGRFEYPLEPTPPQAP